MLRVRVACLLACLLARRACADVNQTQGETDARPFSCEGRPPGYYADVASDCQRYHLCDGGRRFTHSCPDMTRFQQRMMVCDHWYAVDCSAAERDFGANLLIGRRDQPFLDHPHHASGRRRVPHRGRAVGTTIHPKIPPDGPSTPAEVHVPRITFRYVEATSPSSRNRDKGSRQVVKPTEIPEDGREQPPSGVRVHFGTPRRVTLPQEHSTNVFLNSYVDNLEEDDPVPTQPTTTLGPVPGNIFLASQFTRHTTVHPPVTPDPREYVEVRISDPRLMFYIPGSGDENDLGSGGNSTVVIHLDHRHAAMMFRPGGRALPADRNPLCPTCLPAFLAPGRCQPCVTLR